MEDKLYWYKSTCKRVIDGDTLELTIDLGLKTYREERIRLYGINTPEIFGVKKESEEYAKGIAAKNRVEEILKDKDFWVFTVKDSQGKYGRYLAEIYIVINDQLKCLNKVLVEEGLAEEKEY